MNTAAKWRPTTVPRCHWQHENSFLGQANGERYRYDAGSTWDDAVSFLPVFFSWEEIWRSWKHQWIGKYSLLSGRSSIIQSWNYKRLQVITSNYYGRTINKININVLKPPITSRLLHGFLVLAFGQLGELRFSAAHQHQCDLPEDGRSFFQEKFTVRWCTLW